MKFENVQTYGWKNAIRGMRNPKGTWAKSDSFCGVIQGDWDNHDIYVALSWVKHDNPNIIIGSDEERVATDNKREWIITNGTIQANRRDSVYEVAYIGPTDMGLMQRLITAGTEHCKFTRQIGVSVDITAPLYWWKEMDQYKIGTTTDSTSTMHTVVDSPITIDCFEIGDFDKDLIMYQHNPHNPDMYMTEFWVMFVNDLEYLRKKYQETKDKRYWKELIRLIPESWLQKRTWSGNYQNLRNIYFQRKNHKLTEWHTFCDWAKKLPYGEELITVGID